MTGPTTYLTWEGRQRLELQLADLEQALREASARVVHARADSANEADSVDMRDAIDGVALVSGRVQALRNLLLASEMLPREPAPDGTARLGTLVRVRHADGEEATYTLVSPPEADPRRGRVSVEAPVGRALVGAQPGQRVSAHTPLGVEALVVLEVS